MFPEYGRDSETLELIASQRDMLRCVLGGRGVRVEVTFGGVGREALMLEEAEILTGSLGEVLRTLQACSSRRRGHSSP